MEYTKDELKIILSKFEDNQTYYENTELYYKIREDSFRKNKVEQHAN
jgi:hypothetical protein